MKMKAATALALALMLTGCAGEESSPESSSPPAAVPEVITELLPPEPDIPLAPPETSSTESASGKLPETGPSSAVPETSAPEITSAPPAAGSSGTIPLSEAESTAPDAETGTVTSPEGAPKPSVRIAGRSFELETESSPAAAEFLKLLPAKLEMTEFNGNEKYHYLPSSLPAEPKEVGHINAGDLMLYNDNCIVLFYKSFETSYLYTRIGCIADPSGLAEAVGSGDIEAEFTK